MSQISLGIRPVWSVFAVCMKKPWVPSYPLSASEDSNQSGWMPRLIWVFAGRTVILLVLSCRGSNLCWKASGTWVSSSTWFKCLCILMMIYLQPPSFNQIALWGTYSTLCILCHSYRYMYMVWEAYPVYMSRDMTKATEFYCPHEEIWVFDDSLISAQQRLWTDWGQMPRLIWVFPGCTGHFVGFVMWRLN